MATGDNGINHTTVRIAITQPGSVCRYREAGQSRVCARHSTRSRGCPPLLPPAHAIELDRLHGRQQFGVLTLVVERLGQDGLRLSQIASRGTVVTINTSAG